MIRQKRKKSKSLAQFLQSGVFFTSLFLCLVLTPSSVFASEELEPVLLPEVVLVDPVFYVDRVLVSHTSLASEVEVGNSEALLPIETMERAVDVRFGKSYANGSTQVTTVKAVANLGLFGFLGICPRQSESPSKSFSTPCESFPQKSMIQKFANAWKFLWPPVRMTYLSPSSISSYWILKTSIQSPYQNLIHNMSDTSFIWPSATAECHKASPRMTQSLTKKHQYWLMGPNERQQSHQVAKSSLLANQRRQNHELRKKPVVKTQFT